jgi:hypothetical protein
MSIVDFGKRVRIEQHFQQEADGGHRWSVYQLTPVEDGRHPVHDTETTETEVWVKVGEGSEAEARAQAEKLAG